MNSFIETISTLSPIYFLLLALIILIIIASILKLIVLNTKKNTVKCDSCEYTLFTVIYQEDIPIKMCNHCGSISDT
jgi:hypothetical protein